MIRKLAFAAAISFTTLAACSGDGKNESVGSSSWGVTTTGTKLADDSTSRLQSSAEVVTSDPIVIQGTDGKPITIPPGVRMNVPAGTEFRFVAGTRFESEGISPWMMLGIVFGGTLILAIGATMFIGHKVPSFRAKPKAKPKKRTKRKTKKPAAPVVP